MTRWRRFALTAWFTMLFLLPMAGQAFADPLDDAGAKLATFLQRAGVIMAGLIPTAGGLAVAALAVKRAAAKAMGEEEGMARSGNHIAEVLKLTAIGMSASLLVAIAGSILK